MRNQRRSQMKAAQLPRVSDAYMPFSGGLDEETSPWEVPMGRLRGAQNYEQAIQGGYEDIQGYERFDGRTKPSSVSYAILNVVISGEFSVGDTITGATSGHTAEVLAVVTTTSPAYLVITKQTGTFTDTENLEVSASVEGTASGTATVDAASTNQLDAQYKNLAADEYRSDITTVTGSGSILGVVMLSDVVYAFRNNAGGTAAALYKSSTSGWTAVDLGYEIDFTSGSEQPAEGATLDGATSAASATVRRVILESGSWAGGDAAGRLILSGQTGTFQAENVDINGGTANVLTIGGDTTAITLQPNGSYEFYISNFADSAGNQRIYGCDGVNRGFEFDGTTFVPIDTGMATDTPEHVVVHRQHLFFSFGSSVQHSGIGEPYSWTILSGAAELAVDDDVTGMIRQPGSAGAAALSIFSKDRVHILYGTSSLDWELVPYRDQVGARAGTIQNMAYTVFLDDRGLTDLQTSDQFGNFAHSTWSNVIQSTIIAKRSLAVTSCIARDKSQYRIFFSDGTALYCTFDKSTVTAIMPIALDHAPTCMWSAEDSSGNEVILFGASDGYVYQMDKGTSFDGASIDAYFTTHYTNKELRWIKSYMNTATIEARGSGYAEIEFDFDLGYVDPGVPQPVSATQEIEFGAETKWDDPGATWDTGFWDGRTLQPAEGFRLEGDAENISFTIRKSSDYFSPVRHTGIHYRYCLRGPKR